MAANKWGTSLTGMVLGWIMAFGSAGAFMTAFDLQVTDGGAVLLAWALCAAATALLLRWRHGGMAIALTGAFLAGYIWHRGIAGAQFWSLVYRITIIYDSGYGWGVYRRGSAAPDLAADWPLGILGCVIALVTVYGVCRRKSGWPAVLCALIPLCFCVVVTDTVPHEIPLFCLMAGSILLLLTAAVRQETETQGLRLTAAAAVPVLAALAAVFLLIPQSTYVNRAEPLRAELLERARQVPAMLESKARELVSEFQGAAPRQIDLSRVGPQELLTYPVLEVTGENGGSLYLRGQDFDTYTGMGWSASGNRTENFGREGAQADAVTIRSSRGKELFYVPYYPRERVVLTGGKAENKEKTLTYRFSCTALPENWRQLAVEGRDSVPVEDMTPYLMLPDTTRQDAAEWVAPLLSGTNTEKADRIAALVCSLAPYDLNTPAIPEGEPDFALWFLREGDRGYCVHFATAATVLLRAAGVPARYVTGYLVDAVPGKTVVATEADAHAWAEYYEPVLDAWIPLEATPAGETEEGTFTAEDRPVATTAPGLPEEVTGNPAGNGENHQTQPPAALPSLPEPDPVKLTLTARLLVAAAAAVLIANIQRSTRLRIRRRAQRTGSPNEQALMRWRETELLCRLLKESPGEELTALAQKAKFSPHDLNGEELGRFDSHNRACLRQLRAQSWYRRLIHQYIYAIY